MLFQLASSSTFLEAKVWKFPSTETPRLDFTHSRVFLFLYFEFLFLSALLLLYYCFLLRDNYLKQGHSGLCNSRARFALQIKLKGGILWSNA